jgi:hypothetical protein
MIRAYISQVVDCPQFFGTHFRIHFSPYPCVLYSSPFYPSQLNTNIDTLSTVWIIKSLIRLCIFFISFPWILNILSASYYLCFRLYRCNSFERLFLLLWCQSPRNGQFIGVLKCYQGSVDINCIFNLLAIKYCLVRCIKDHVKDMLLWHIGNVQGEYFPFVLRTITVAECVGGCRLFMR